MPVFEQEVVAWMHAFASYLQSTAAAQNMDVAAAAFVEIAALMKHSTAEELN